MPKAATVPKPSYSQVWPARNMTGSAHKVGAGGGIRSVGKTWLCRRMVLIRVRGLNNLVNA
jgi:hypothetical protein